MGLFGYRCSQIVGVLLAAGMMICAASSKAQSAAVDYDNVRFKRISVEDGLSQASIRAMIQDADGFVWLGTQDGLNRYDGYQFQVYHNDPLKADSLPDNHVMALERARSGGFWVGTQAGGLARFIPATGVFDRYPHGGKVGSITGSTIWALHETDDGTLWVSSGADSLQWLPAGSRLFKSISPSIARTIGTVNSIVSFHDKLLLASATGLWILDPNGQGARPFTTAEQMVASNCIEISPNGKRVWVGTIDHGLMYFDTSGRPLGQLGDRERLSNGQILDLQFDRAGRLWVGTMTGLSRVETPATAPRTTLKVWKYGKGLTGSVPTSRIHSLMLDRDGLIWAGSWRNGVNLHVPQSEAFWDISIRTSDQSASGSSVYGVEVAQDGSLWFGMPENMGLVHYNPIQNTVEQFQHHPDDPSSLPDWSAPETLIDRHNQLWVATYNGLGRKQGTGFVTYRHVKGDPNSLPENVLHSLYSDRSGILWISSRHGFISALCDGCTQFHNYLLGDGSQRAEAMLEDSRGNFWVGGAGIGLFRLNRKLDKFEQFATNTGKSGGLSHSTITVLMEDSHHRLWVGTQGGGLNQMLLDANGKARFVTYGVHEGLAAAAIGGVVEDARGNLWISTTVGISRLDPNTGAIVNFGPAAGAQLMGYFVGAAARLPDGRIAFGGMQGVTVLDPANIKSLPSPRNVGISELTILRQNHNTAGSSSPEPLPGDWRLGNELSLPPDVNDISISLSALSYAAPQAVQYAYRMDGVSDDWVEVDASHRRVNYNNLAPGRYMFRAKARMPDSPWGAELTLPIHLRPAWWQTTWAKTGYGLIVLLIFGTIGWEIRSRQNERMRSQTAIAESEQRLKLALWGSGDELWDWGLADNVLRRQNPLDSTTKDHDDTRIEHMSALRKTMHPSDRVRLDQSIPAQLNKGSSIEASYRVRGENDGWIWRLSRGRVVERNSSGTPLRVVGISSDITRIKENEVELARVNAELETRVAQRTQALHDSNSHLMRTVEDLQQAQQQLVEAEKMAALGGLVAGVAHEINTPIGVSVTAASFLQEQASKLQLPSQESLQATDIGLDELQRFRSIAIDSSQLILRNLGRADRLIKSFKQVAVDQSSEASRMIELSSYLDEIMVSLQPSLRRTTVELDCPSQIHLETYPGAIYQIVSNLVMNSITHGFESGTPGLIHISTEATGNHARLRYQDNGIGMDEITRKKMFEPFFTTKRGKGGSGLGMHITWNLVTQVLGGTISCESTPGHGACFTITLPIRAP